MTEETHHHEREDELLQFLLFHSAGQHYGISLMSIIEIRRWQSLTKLPQSASYIKGVVNLRGQIVPIVDLASKLGSKPTEINSHKTVYLVISSGDMHVGLLVDGVDDILSVNRSDIKQDADIIKSNDCHHSLTSGFITSDERPLILLDAEVFFEEKIVELIEEKEIETAEN